MTVDLFATMLEINALSNNDIYIYVYIYLHQNSQTVKKGAAHAKKAA